MIIRTPNVITREFLSNLKFRQFDKYDFQAFSGVESPCPLIAETTVDIFDCDVPGIVILDGNYAELILYVDGGPETVEFIEDVSKLPY